MIPPHTHIHPLPPPKYLSTSVELGPQCHGFQLRKEKWPIPTHWKVAVEGTSQPGLEAGGGVPGWWWWGPEEKSIINYGLISCPPLPTDLGTDNVGHLVSHLHGLLCAVWDRCSVAEHLGARRWVAENWLGQLELSVSLPVCESLSFQGLNFSLAI